MVNRDDFLKKMGLIMAKKRMEKSGLSQRKLSEAIGKEFSYMNMVEQGHVNISIMAFMQICDVLELDPKEFFA